MKDAFWFRHDSNAQHDERVLELRAEYGWEGYGLFWALIERMRDAPDYRLSMATLGGMAASMGILKPLLAGIIDLSCKHGLFALEAESAYFYSPSLRRRMSQWEEKKEALSEAGKLGAERKRAKKAQAALEQQQREEQATLKPPLQDAKPPLSHPDDFGSIEEKRREEESRVLSDSECAGEEVALILPLESPDAQASHTEGGAADVPTQVDGPAPYKAYDPDEFSPALVLPFDSGHFRTGWAKWRRYNAEELRRPLGGGMREQEALRKLGQLAKQSELVALAIIDQAISKGWKDLFPLDSSSPAFNPPTANPQRNAVHRTSSYSNQNSAAARLHTPAPSAEAGWGYPGQ